MKSSQYFLCALLGVMFSATSWAAPPSVPVCRIQLGGGASIDYGNIKRGMLRNAEAARLPPQQRTVTVNCEQPVAIALQLSAGDGTASPAASNRLGAPADIRHGVGLTEGRPVGAFVLRWRRETAVLDGVPARLIVSGDGGATWRDVDADTVLNGTERIAWARGEPRRPASGSVFTVGVLIETAIAPTSTMYMGREIKLDGSIDLLAIYQ